MLGEPDFDLGLLGFEFVYESWIVFRYFVFLELGLDESFWKAF